MACKILKLPTFYRHPIRWSVRPEEGANSKGLFKPTLPQHAKIIPTSTKLLQNTDITRCIRETFCLCQSDELGRPPAGPSRDVHIYLYLAPSIGNDVTYFYICEKLHL